MDPNYKPLYQRVDDLRFRAHDAFDQPDHPTAHLLKRELESLKDDIESNKSPRTVEDRIKTIQHQLLQAKSQQHGVMSYQHADDLHDHFEHMRMDLRKFHNY
jgi:hypothetical protein